MIVGRALSLVLVLGFTACGAPTEARTLPSAIEKQMTLNAQRYGIAGQAVLVLRGRKTLYRGSQGLADREKQVLLHPRSLFPMFSVSKLFAAILVMQMVEQGHLELGAPIGRYLPDLPARWRRIKVDQVLNHVSGLPEYFEPGRFPLRLPATRDAVFRELANRTLLFEAGTRTEYTQTNFLIVGAILEAHYQMPYRALVAERIVKPLGLNSTYFGKAHVPGGAFAKTYVGRDNQLVPDHVIDWPEYAIVHAELYSTIDDLGAFLTAVSEGRLVRREILQKLWKPYRLRDGTAGWFASGWESGKSGRYRTVGHDGGTKVRVSLLFDDGLTEDAYVCVYLTNGSAANVWSRTLVDSVMAVVPGEAPP